MSESQELTCPRGHRSTEADYCSECGAKMEGAMAGGLGSVSFPPEVAFAGSSAAERCPDCGTPREQPDIGFCEVCGYNFRTGAHGEIGILPAIPDEEASQREAPGPVAKESEAPTQDAAVAAPQWRVCVSGSPELEDGSSEPVPAMQPCTVDLTEDTYLIGRSDPSRGIRPEIAIDFDEAVSRRHALLQRNVESGGWLLRDIGAANGTRLNGEELVPMQDYALRPGDEITLGHRTRLYVETV